MTYLSVNQRNTDPIVAPEESTLGPKIIEFLHKKK